MTFFFGRNKQTKKSHILSLFDVRLMQHKPSALTQQTHTGPICVQKVSLSRTITITLLHKGTFVSAILFSDVDIQKRKLRIKCKTLGKSVCVCFLFFPLVTADPGQPRWPLEACRMSYIKAYHVLFCFTDSQISAEVCTYLAG